MSRTINIVVIPNEERNLIPQPTNIIAIASEARAKQSYHKKQIANISHSADIRNDENIILGVFQRHTEYVKQNSLSRFGYRFSTKLKHTRISKKETKRNI